MTTRLHVMCSASTSSVSSIAFPTDEPLDSRGRKSLFRLSGRFPWRYIVLRSPARPAHRQPKGLRWTPEPSHCCAIAIWAAGRGVPLQRFRRRGLRRSQTNVMTRVGAWMDGLLAGSGSVPRDYASFGRSRGGRPRTSRRPRDFPTRRCRATNTDQPIGRPQALDAGSSSFPKDER
jgi:hypothetical protein